MISKFAVLTLALILISSISFSQVQWTRTDSLFGQLPPSIKVYESNDSLDGKPFKAYYVEANLKNKKLEFTTQAEYGKRLTPSTFYSKERNPFIVVNGTFFSFQTNQNLNLLIRKKSYYLIMLLPSRVKVVIAFNIIIQPEALWESTKREGRMLPGPSLIQQSVGCMCSRIRLLLQKESTRFLQ